MLDEALEEKHPGGAVIRVDPRKFKTPTGSLADGIYLLHSEKKLYLLEAKYTGDVRAFPSRAFLSALLAICPPYLTRACPCSRMLGPVRQGVGTAQRL